MKAALAPLAAELALWRDAGLVLPVWWRDDDAVEPTPRLERLVALAARHRAPLHLAVVPQPATPDLAGLVAEADAVFALPHGWRHANHAPAGARKAEFGAHRPAAAMADEIGGGWRRLRELFGPRALPVFVPPWNRVAPDLFALLPGLGIAAVSTFTPRAAPLAAAGLAAVNTHLDPIDWHAGRGLRDPAALAAQAVRELADRRLGRADDDEPYGLLTHHLVHDEAVWAFAETWLEMLAESRVARWTPVV